jgi:aminobenzoyl-glutamate utilization protein B
MIVAAKTIALTAYDLITNPNYIKTARAEWEKLRGPDFKYVPLLGDRKPALDYRD